MNSISPNDKRYAKIIQRINYEVNSGEDFCFALPKDMDEDEARTFFRWYEQYADKSYEYSIKRYCIGNVWSDIKFIGKKRM